MIDTHPELLGARGIDWGSGSGILAVAAASHPGVELVVGLEIDPAQVRTARTNAELNGVADRTVFIRTDLFEPFPHESSESLEALEAAADFLVANPPASSGDDGLGWRRAVLEGALRYLRPGGTALLQVSRQYGLERIAGLAAAGYRYLGLVGSSEWVPFDLDRPDLFEALEGYVAEETRTGEPYPFLHPIDDLEIDARTTRRIWEAERVSPRSQWQVHRYEPVDK